MTNLISYLMIAYIALALQGSIVAANLVDGRIAVSLGPALVMLAFRWFKPALAVALSSVVMLLVEMQYQAIPGSGLVTLTFVSLMLSQRSVHYRLQYPLIWWLTCLPVVFVFDYALVFVTDMLSTKASAESTPSPLEIIPFWPSIRIAIGTFAVTGLWLIWTQGVLSLVSRPRSLPRG